MSAIYDREENGHAWPLNSPDLNFLDITRLWSGTRIFYKMQLKPPTVSDNENDTKEEL